MGVFCFSVFFFFVWCVWFGFGGGGGFVWFILLFFVCVFKGQEPHQERCWALAPSQKGCEHYDFVTGPLAKETPKDGVTHTRSSSGEYFITGFNWLVTEHLLKRQRKQTDYSLLWYLGPDKTNPSDLAVIITTSQSHYCLKEGENQAV